MRRPFLCILLIVFLCSTACSDDAVTGANNQDVRDTEVLDATDDAANPDVKADAKADADAVADIDVSELEDVSEPDGVSDASDGDDEGSGDAAGADVVEDAGDTEEDAAFEDGNGEDVSENDAEDRDTIEEDTYADAGADPYQGRPRGQCTQSSECPEGPMGAGMCSRPLPGGACTGCGTDAHCPSGTTCKFGNCVGECDDDNDCAPGLHCNSAGLCAAIRCVDGQCPVPLFDCGSLNQCTRIDCNADPGVCPAQTTCINGRCIEDRM